LLADIWTPTRVAVIFNPVSGGPRNRSVSGRRRELTAALSAVDVRWYETTPARPAEICARLALADGAELILAAGGDGTTSACAKILADTTIPLAIVPVGTGNLLAAVLGMPLNSAAALHTAFHGREQLIDAGTSYGELFFGATSIGFGAAVIRDARPRRKSHIGLAAYLLSAIKHLRYPADIFSVTIDGADPLVRRCHSIVIGNLGPLSRRALGFEMGLSDGKLEVAIIRIWPLWDWLPWRRIPGRRPPVEWHQGRRVEIRSVRVHPIERDGEHIGYADRVTAETVPSCLKIRIPPPGQSPVFARRLVLAAVADLLWAVLRLARCRRLDTSR
jgi:diacylglycerol kinase family enzyme